MRRLTSSFFLILNLVSAAVFSQESPEKSNPTSWYTSDGSNELVLMVKDDFALFESQLWEIDQTTSERIVLKNRDKNLALLISKNGDNYTLINGDKKTPIQPQKSKDLRNRKVGQTDVSNDFFNKDQVLLQGVVLPKESMPSTVSITYNHAFGDGQRQFSGEVDEQGRFKVIFPLEYPQEVMVIIGRAIFKLFSTPGAKQAMVVDESSFNGGISSWTELKNIDFMGDLAVENEERRRLEPEFMKVRDYLLTDSMQKTLEPEAFMAYRVDLMKKHESFYKRYIDSIPVSSLVQDISIRSVRIYAADDLRRYIWLHSKIVDGRLSPIDVSDDYIRGVKNLLTNDLEDLMTSEFANLMREFTMPIQPSEMKVISDQMNQLTYELFKKLDLTETQLSGVEAWYDQIKKGVPRDSLVTSEEFKELSKSHQSTIFKFFKEAQWPHLLAKIADLGSIPRSSIIATFMDINYQATGEEIPEYIQNQLATLDLEPEILAVIEEEIANFERTKNELFVEGVAISENTESVLTQLKEKHPGKVIYIDVWATWCGPCIGEFKQAERLKKEAPEGVVFAYICGQSEREMFENMIKKFELSGEHFFLDQESYQKFDKELNITGFPTYLLITKEGKLIREGIHRPSSGDQLTNQLKDFVTR